MPQHGFLNFISRNVVAAETIMSSVRLWNQKHPSSSIVQASPVMFQPRRT